MTMQKQNAALLTGCLCALGCETLYGLSFIFTKKAVESASAFALLGWRFAIAFCVFSLCVASGLIRTRIRKEKLPQLLQIALLFPVVYFFGETIGIRHTSASESGIFIASVPIFSLLLSTFVLHKKPTPPQVTGSAITLIGCVTTVVSQYASANFSPAGYLFLSLAVISYAFSSILIEKAAGLSGADITYAMLASGALVYGLTAMTEAAYAGSLPALLALPCQNPDFLTAILYQGIGCSVLAFFLSNVAIAKIGVNRTASFIGVATLVSILSGCFVLHEHLSGYQIIGSILIIAGVYIANRR